MPRHREPTWEAQRTVRSLSQVMVAQLARPQNISLVRSGANDERRALGGLARSDLLAFSQLAAIDVLPIHHDIQELHRQTRAVSEDWGILEMKMEVWLG